MRPLRSARLEAFSDGVFAIAITLLVLEIAVPEDAGEDLLDAFVDQWPSYLAYAVSFVTIGAVWLAHTSITHFVDSVDSVLARLNLLLLLFVSFLPFPTGLLGHHIHDQDAERVATTIFGINLLLIAMLGVSRRVNPRTSSGSASGRTRDRSRAVISACWSRSLVRR